MPQTTTAAEASHELPALNAVLAPYKEPVLRLSLWQLVNTLVPLAAAWAGMFLAYEARSWWLMLLLAVPAAGLLMRLFVLQHDCGHGSFFKSAWANDALGSVLGVLTFTPYHFWRQAHAIHHSTSGNLDRRGWGDIDTLTVREYAALGRWGRLRYRVYRSIPVLFFIGPVFHFLVYHRLPGMAPADWRRERLGILLTDAALAAVLWTASRTIGLGAFLSVHGTIVALGACAGVWLFYVQHQYENAYWDRDGGWDFARASLRGSSFYDLHPVLQWFTGNIGFHHIHHLNSRIPNYRLEPCMRENPVFQSPTRLTLLDSLKCVRLALWDESRRRLVSFAEAGV